MESEVSYASNALLLLFMIGQECLNEARRELFCQKNHTMENIPPMQDALQQHSKPQRVSYQAGIWTTSDQPQQEAPSPEEYGRTLNKDNLSWVPVWCTLPLSSAACSELIKSGCKSDKGCGARCSCRKAKWNCTELCSHM